jgi:hypothetical protein
MVGAGGGLRVGVAVFPFVVADRLVLVLFFGLVPVMKFIVMPASLDHYKSRERERGRERKGQERRRGGCHRTVSELLHLFAQKGRDAVVAARGLNLLVLTEDIHTAGSSEWISSRWWRGWRLVADLTALCGDNYLSLLLFAFLRRVQKRTKRERDRDREAE